jgi:hypothetical protein
LGLGIRVEGVKARRKERREGGREGGGRGGREEGIKGAQYFRSVGIWASE